MTEGTTPQGPPEEPRRQPPGTPEPPAEQPPPSYRPADEPPPPPPTGWEPPAAGGPPPPWDEQGGYPPPQATSGLSENVASGLSYVLGWVTGLIFYLVDRRPEVRFHAMQSIIFAVVATLVSWLRVFTSGLFAGLLWLVSVVFFFTWIFVMIQAFQGNHFKLPVIGDYAEQQARGR
jgi:uncharacterized membrane protein